MSVSLKRRQELERITRKQIASAIEYDLASGESLMKEAYEACCGRQTELDVVYTEMRRIVQLLKAADQ